MSDECLREDPNFKANLPSPYMTPTSYKFCFFQDPNYDHYAANASKNVDPLTF